MKKSYFTIIIPIYNVAHFLPGCLSTVFKSKYKNFEVIIVDDNSSDNSIEIIKDFQKKHKNLTLIKNTRNMGPSGSRNVALQKVNTEFVYFLDSDTEVSPNFLLEVKRIFDSHKDCGAVQSLLLYFDKRQVIQNSGLKLIRQTGWAIGLNEGKNVKNAPNKPFEIVGLSAALAIKTEVFRKGIQFDPRFFHYSEDLDFSWRMWIAGYKTFLAPKSLVYHKVKSVDSRKNVGANSTNIYFHLSKNSLRAIVKNYNLLNLLVYFPQCVFVLVARAILVLLVRGDITSLMGTIQAFAWFVKYLPDTLKARFEVQRKTRKSKDKEFLNTIMIDYNLLTIYKKHFAQTKLLPI